METDGSCPGRNILGTFWTEKGEKVREGIWQNYLILVIGRWLFTKQVYVSRKIFRIIKPQIKFRRRIQTSATFEKRYSIIRNRAMLSNHTRAVSRIDSRQLLAAVSAEGHRRRKWRVDTELEFEVEFEVARFNETCVSSLGLDNSMAKREEKRS